MLSTFQAFQSQQAVERIRQLQSLFHILYPWVLHSVERVTVERALLLPQESVCATLFARTAHREDLPHAADAYHLWAELIILREIVLGGRGWGLAQSELCVREFAVRFNRLAPVQRHLLLGLMRDRVSATTLIDQHGMTDSQFGRLVSSGIAQLQSSARTEVPPLPRGWQWPEAVVLRSTHPEHSTPMTLDQQGATA